MNRGAEDENRGGEALESGIISCHQITRSWKKTDYRVRRICQRHSPDEQRFSGSAVRSGHSGSRESHAHADNRRSAPAPAEDLDDN